MRHAFSKCHASFLVLALLTAGTMAHAAHAQDEKSVEEPKPQVTLAEDAVQDNPLEKLDTLNNAMITIELFSSQACVFCPKADAFMQKFIDNDKIVALSCHVDYFDVKKGSFALPGCSLRQETYEGALNAGPKYTPQMVIDGDQNVVGYRRPDVWRALDKAMEHPVASASLLPVDGHNGHYELSLPDISAGTQKPPYNIVLFVYDRPKTKKVADGANRGRTITYYNVVSQIKSLGTWDGMQKTVSFSIEAAEQNKGLAVLAQRQDNDEIVAAAKYTFKTAEDKSVPAEPKNRMNE